MTPELEKVMHNELKRNLVSHASSDEVASFVLGFNIAIAHLEKQAGEFDEHSAVIEGEERQDLLSRWDEPDVFADGARYQFEQCKARIGLMRDNLHSREIQINELKDRLAESERSLKHYQNELSIALLNGDKRKDQLGSAHKRIETLSQLIRDKGMK